MATSKSPRSRTSKVGLSKKTGFQFKWWMAAIVVAVVAIVGIVIIRLSFAYRDCGTASGGELCGTGPTAVKILATTKSGQCGLPQPTSKFDQRCIVFVNNNGFTAKVDTYQPQGAQYLPASPSVQFNKNYMFKLDSPQNTECGYLSKDSPWTTTVIGGMKRFVDPHYQTEDNIYYGSTYTDQNLWWTPVGCKK